MVTSRAHVTGRADTEGEIAADIASSGSVEITEPRPRDYEYIAEKVADNVFPMHPKEDGYKGRGQEDVMAMARLHVYRHLVEDLESFPDAERHLKKYDGVVSRLGLEKPRSRETIRRSWNEQFDVALQVLAGFGECRREAAPAAEQVYGRDGVVSIYSHVLPLCDLAGVLFGELPDRIVNQQRDPVAVHTPVREVLKVARIAFERILLLALRTDEREVEVVRPYSYIDAVVGRILCAVTVIRLVIDVVVGFGGAHYVYFAVFSTISPF